MRRRIGKCDSLTWPVGLLLLTVCRSARADGILPFMVAPAGVMLLFPVVALMEAGVIWRMLGGTKWRAVRDSFVCNLGSTVVGATIGFFIPWRLTLRLTHAQFAAQINRQHVVSLLITLAFSTAMFLITWAAEFGCL